ncbi:MAG: hypothetical protein IIC73_08680 [Armatimonadetes bacterium]|nr:hypothetical protein [Armatimonadota bacterium]
MVAGGNTLWIALPKALLLMDDSVVSLRSARPGHPQRDGRERVMSRLTGVEKPGVVLV